MPFPTSDRVAYGKAPLAEVICQLRFPTILRITVGDPADFQDAIRQDYPLYRLEEPMMAQLPKELSAILGQLNLPKPPGALVHRFAFKDSSRAVTLSQDFLALIDSKYTRWESFRGELEKAVNALDLVYRPSFYTRIGLRYKNVVSRSDLGVSETKWQDLLQPYVLGPLGADEIAELVLESQTHSRIDLTEVPGGQVRLVHGLVILPGHREKCFVIDSDFSITSEEGISEPFDILDRFNRLAGNLFRWAIRPELHRLLEPAAI